MAEHLRVWPTDARISFRNVAIGGIFHDRDRYWVKLGHATAMRIGRDVAAGGNIVFLQEELVQRVCVGYR